MRNGEFKRKDRERERLQELVADLGWKKVCALVHLYCENYPDQDRFETTIFKWTGFLENYRAYLPEVDAEMKHLELCRQNQLRWTREAAEAEIQRQERRAAAELQRKLEERRKREAGPERLLNGE
jgi:hypothetical protein